MQAVHHLLREGHCWQLVQGGQDGKGEQVQGGERGSVLGENIIFTNKTVSTTNTGITSYREGLEAGHREEKFVICKRGSTIMSITTSTDGSSTECENRTCS